MMLLMHCHADGRIAGFWTSLDDAAYGEDEDDLEAIGDTTMDAYEQSEWDDIVDALSDTWSSEGGWASMEFPDMTAAEVHTLFFGE